MKKLGLLLLPLLLASCGSTTETTYAAQSTTSQTINYTKYTRDEFYNWSVDYENGGKLIITYNDTLFKKFDFGKWEVIYTITSARMSDEIYDYGDYCIVHSYYRK